jgi:hypothetical protein
MHPRTVQALAQLEDASWFSHVGVQDAEGAIVLTSWQQAIACCGSAETKNLWLEAANQYHMRILERSKERYRQWNDVANEMRPIVNAFVNRKIATVVRENLLDKVFENHVRWEMMHLCIESEFADVYPPGFFASHAYWYIRGHFPCGWRGQFPNSGRLVVY